MQHKENGKKNVKKTKKCIWFSFVWEVGCDVSSVCMHLREVQATFLDQRIDHTVHDGHQQQYQNGVESLSKRSNK